ncbi:MAG: transporter substrate-binding domain-containing protein, partial [Aeromonas veronii]
LPFLKTPEKQALLKKVDEALTAMRKDGSLRQISEKWFASDITDK